MKKFDIKKQGGFVLTAELILLVTILVVGMIVGLVTIRDSMTAEMEDVAEAIGSLDQSYAFEGMSNAQNTALSEPSSFGDGIDFTAGDVAAYSFTAVDGFEGAVGVAPSTGGSGPVAPGTLVP